MNTYTPEHAATLSRPHPTLHHFRECHNRCPNGCELCFGGSVYNPAVKSFGYRLGGDWHRSHYRTAFGHLKALDTAVANRVRLAHASGGAL